MQITENGIQRTTDGHFEVPLPLQYDETFLPNNKAAVEKRLQGLKSRLSRDERYKRDYCEFMHSVISNGFAEEVPDSELQTEDSEVWYVPHY